MDPGKVLPYDLTEKRLKCAQALGYRSVLRSGLIWAGSSYGLFGKLFQGYALLHGPFGVSKTMKETKSVRHFLTLLRSSIFLLSLSLNLIIINVRKLKEHGWYGHA